MKKLKRGFTLMEMLIVVAIIAILVAIAIPTFSSALEKTRRAVDMANARNIYAVLSTAYLDGTIEFPGSTENVKGVGDVSTQVAVVVHKSGADYRASGSVKINGNDWHGDSTAYARVINLLSSAGIGDLKCNARSTSNNGWVCYCVVLTSDGNCRILSSDTDINIGGSSGGDFENVMKNLIAANAEGTTGIEKAIGG